MTVLAACRRASVLALAVVGEGVVLDVCRHRLDGQANAERIAALVRRTAADYGTAAIIAEPGSVVGLALAAAGVQFFSVTVSEARERLLAPTSGRLRHHLYARLLENHPQLRRFLRSVSGRVSASDRWRTAPLLAVALGLGATGQLLAPPLADNCLLK